MSVLDPPETLLADEAQDAAARVPAFAPQRTGSLAGAVVLVTGSSRGIGAAIARELSARRSRVLLHGRPSETLDRIAAELGTPALAYDLHAHGGPEALARAALEAFGRVDGVVHCAGVGHYGDLASMPDGTVDQLVDVGLRAPLELTRLLLPGMMRAGRGHVCFVSSIAGLTGVAHEAAYSAVKAAVLVLAQALRLELAESGISVCAVCPAAVDTGFFATRGARYDRRFPRMWTPERVAASVVETIERGGTCRVLPRWLAVAPAFRLLAPRLYETLALRFG